MSHVSRAVALTLLAAVALISARPIRAQSANSIAYSNLKNVSITQSTDATTGITTFHLSLGQGAQYQSVGDTKWNDLYAVGGFYAGTFADAYDGYTPVLNFNNNTQQKIATVSPATGSTGSPLDVVWDNRSLGTGAAGLANQANGYGFSGDYLYAQGAAAFSTYAPTFTVASGKSTTTYNRASQADFQFRYTKSGPAPTIGHGLFFVLDIVGTGFGSPSYTGRIEVAPEASSLEAFVVLGLAVGALSLRARRSAGGGSRGSV